jgi:Methyltransferase domain
VTRTEILNALIRSRGYKSYLEIGVSSGHNFKQIECLDKIGVDPEKWVECLHHLRSDDFFEQTDCKFDIVFVDGQHLESQVNRDISNSLAHLNPGGVVVLHDCLPPDEWHQRPLEEFRWGENWNGTVWKSVLKTFANSPWHCYIVDCDWGCGVIDTNEFCSNFKIQVPTGDLDYRTHFDLLRGFVISEIEFLRKIECGHREVGGWLGPSGGLAK